MTRKSAPARLMLALRRMSHAFGGVAKLAEQGKRTQSGRTTLCVNKQGTLDTKLLLMASIWNGLNTAKRLNDLELATA
jgi:hypothetical protein